MEDLAAVKDKGHITVKLNSCGGDLYTGIAIHNALKTRADPVPARRAFRFRVAAAPRCCPTGRR